MHLPSLKGAALLAVLLLPLPALGGAFEISRLIRGGINGNDGISAPDIDGDGDADLVAIVEPSVNSFRLDLQINLGKGVLGPAVTFSNSAPWGSLLVSGDVTGDGKDDLIAAGRSSSGTEIAVYKSTGTTLQLQGSISTPAVSRLVLADINGDQSPDLVYGTAPSTGTPLLLWRPNNGSGTFGTARQIAAVGSVRGLVAADLDKDGNADVAMADLTSNRIVWYQNDGKGTFGTARIVQDSMSNLREIRGADMDKDGDIDLLSTTSTEIYAHRNVSGNFTRTLVGSTSADSTIFRVADFDNDGFPDIIHETGNPIQWRRNLGNGNFSSGEVLPNHLDLISLKEAIPADIDADGRTDVLGLAFGGSSLWVYENAVGEPPQIGHFRARDGNNTLATGETTTLEWQINETAELRLNGELVTGTSKAVTGTGKDTIYTLTAKDADGTSKSKLTIFAPKTYFEAPRTVATLTAFNTPRLAVGDVNGDGRPDVAYAASNGTGDGNRVGWIANTGSAFAAPVILDTSVDSPRYPALVDVDKDGDLDLLVPSNAGLFLYRNPGNGSFQARVLVDSSGSNRVKAYDVDSDGDMDLVTQSLGTNPMEILLNNGTGTFTALAPLAISGGSDFLLADLTGDGIRDLLVTSNSSASYVPGTGPTSFGSPFVTIFSDVGSTAGSPHVLDYDKDGIQDVILCGGVYLVKIRGLGSGRFWTDGRTLSSGMTGFTLADLDWDGDPDVARTSQSNVTGPAWLENDGKGIFSETHQPQASFDSANPCAADVDGDGDNDIIYATNRGIEWVRNGFVRPPPPEIPVFTSSYPVVHRGESVTLSWNVTGDLPEVRLSGIGEVDGSSVTLTPTATTTYTLTVKTKGGTTTKEITVAVVDTPVIHAFTTDKNNVDRTTRINLSWQVVGADQLSISPGIGAVTGSNVQRPIYQTTTFILTATNEHGSDTKELVVNVDPSLFRFAATIPGPAAARTPVVQQSADFDLDGRPDVVAASENHGGGTAGTIYWIRSTGNGTFGPAQVIQSNTNYGASDLTVADLNGDGRPDFATVSGVIGGDFPNSRVQWFKNLPGGGWEAVPLESGADTLTAIHAVDWDLDGRPDLVATAESRMTKVVWFRNLGGGNFAPRADLGGNFEEARRITSADLDGDHDPDLVISRRASAGDLFALMNAGDGTISEQRVLLARSDVRFFDLGDLDGDKDIDIVATSADQFRCERFLNDGTGHFGEGLRLIPTQQIGSGMSLGDVDSDGDLDVVWLNGTFKWSENLGDGSFRNEEPSPTLQRALAGSPLLADFDGDGDLDALGKPDTTDKHHDWFENLSTPTSTAPVIAEFSASDAVILPGKRLDLRWIVTGFPTSLEITPAVQSTALLLTQRGATVNSVVTDTETVQSYTLIARNAIGETRREVSFRVGNPPLIRSFTAQPLLVNIGDPVTLAWDVFRADHLDLGGTGDVSSLNGIKLIPGTAPFTSYQLSAGNIFGTTDAVVAVEVNRPPVALPLPGFTANAAGDPMEVETAAAFSDPDENDHFTWSLTGNSLPGLFTSVAIDPATGKLTASFTDYLDGESLLTIRGTDRNGLHAESTLLVTLPRVPDPALQFGGEVTVNRQSGLFEQSLKITNSGARAIGGFRIEIRGLPEGFSVRGAEAPAAGEPWVLVFHQPVAAGAAVEVKIEYFSTRRGGADLSPQIAVIQIAQPGAVAAPEGRMFQIDRMLRLEDGSMLLEWDATPGRRYGVEYANGDTMEWKRSPVIVTAATARLQWIDQGPPKTESHPSTVPMRFYRVVELDEP